MEAGLLKTLGQIAGIGGISLGVFFLLFRDLIRKKIFPQLPEPDAFKLLVLISVLVWSVALAGIGAWVWGGKQAAPSINQNIIRGTGIINTGSGDVNTEKPLDK